MSSSNLLQDETPKGVAEWLKSLGTAYANLATTFEENGVDKEMLMSLTEGDLETELGVTKKLLRTAILKKRDNFGVSTENGEKTKVIGERYVDQGIKRLFDQLKPFDQFNKIILPSLENNMSIKIEEIK